MPKKLKIYYIALVVTLTSLLYSSSALALSLGTPFGGKILTYTPCTCGFGTAIVTVGTPRPGIFLYVPYTSKPYSYYFPSIGRWILGLASPTPMPCMMGVLPYCVSVGSYSPITMFGTSLR
ncbi:MAG: hypothetical protein UW46_C0002G0032 [Candidatus Yanofskybacteria bacterium GW2011_GWF1_44_227]|uniref:Secreted protein n=1 Tax=Candidatus Yanofskybacteria bacterium GW2011_GWE2_40_11 TaxID=1619033 RepID=A0A0G0QKM9_9BACT|nr:MAG: hypothetical protein UT75_C0006G0032 [Candidatus Yanofskybacteria bacterium GW2011_GWE2_40_11]KKT15786.1 MAG: hypothetical protein UV97_C0002G0032 [Candidatus Yanofskybacteria bacterium GW2011_GWF2_43_596]KKT53476.1 MAG: hypothetical protein UW46_C0002G0032 [Candidatus Yanofskybacteria bacterium GW2011_GWF1_44_227]OGN37285.1 MAG: hypothetical protein A2302_03080 [Candidatus Yanofskybacteria bacterium RIFOXYB2_FULL_44_18]OGN37845.1 MAG: hypothetical protein A2371_01510 [Candidatus Yanofs